MRCQYLCGLESNTKPHMASFFDNFFSVDDKAESQNLSEAHPNGHSEAHPGTSKLDEEEVHRTFPAIQNTPLIMDTAKTFCRWWWLVKQLPDYKLVPKTVQALVEGVVDKFVKRDTSMMGVLKVLDVAVDCEVEALHLPLVYINLHNAFEKTRKVPIPYLVAVAKTLTLRKLLHGKADGYIHWAEKQLPSDSRVFIIPHGDGTHPDPPMDVQQLVNEAVTKATTEYTPTLWKLLESYERFAHTFPRTVTLPALDLEKRDVYRKVLAWGDLQGEEDKARLRAIVESIDKKEVDTLESERAEWFKTLL